MCTRQRITCALKTHERIKLQCSRILLTQQSWQTLRVKDQVVNILGFVGPCKVILFFV